MQSFDISIPLDVRITYNPEWDFVDIAIGIFRIHDFRKETLRAYDTGDVIKAIKKPASVYVSTSNKKTTFVFLEPKNDTPKTLYFSQNGYQVVEE